MGKMIFRLIFLTIMTRSLVASQNETRKSIQNYLMHQPEVLSALFALYIQLPNSECLDHLKSLGTNITTGDVRALKMLDASAKPQAGILFGNIIHVGSFDECMGLEEKYCTVPFNLRLEIDKKPNETVRGFFREDRLPRNLFVTDTRNSFGLCVPKVCNVSDLQIIANVTENALQIPAHLTFEEDKCYTTDSLPLSKSARISIVIFGIFALIIIISTIYDLLLRRYEKKANLGTSFSIISNAQKLFSTTSQHDVKCLNGMRVISLMWILFTQRVAYSTFRPNVNAAYIYLWSSRLENIFILAASTAIDTFYTISGLLVVYIFLKNRENGTKFSLLKYYLNRIFRLTPSLAMAVLLTASLLKYMGNGPFWWTVDQTQEACRRYWWPTLFYIQNYFHLKPKETCMFHIWYLAADTQMYFLAPFILIPLIRWPKTVLFTVLSLIFVSCAYVIVPSVDHSSPAASTNKIDYGLLVQMYLPSHVRVSSYLIGMLCGYYLHYIKNKPFKLKKWKVFIVWTISALMLLAIIVCHFVFVAINPSSLETSFFNCLIRVCWSIGVSVIILLCASGHGELINSFLSHKIFTVLIRLNYNVYILHELTLTLTSAQLRTPQYFSNVFMVHQFWGDYVFTLGMAVIWTLAFESPMVALCKRLLKK